MSLQITAETFDELSDKMAMYAMENFKCNSSRVDDVELTCFSTKTDNIRAHITERTKKMIQLRRMYVNENEIDRSHREMIKNGTGTFNFNQVKHDYDHVQGGCLLSMILTPDEVTVNLRASVVPWNLQFDLVLIDDLLKEMGIQPKKILFKIGYVRTKVIHALYWYIRNGWTPEQICQYRFGRACIAAYTRGKRPTCKYRNWIRFTGRVDKLREEYGIGDLVEALEHWKAINNTENLEKAEENG